MSDHDEIQMELPSFAAGRLDAAARAGVEAHLAECEECRDLAGTFGELAAAVGDSGESLFAPHPAEAELRRFAHLQGKAQDPRIREHLEVCVTCALEADAWKRRALPASGLARPTWGVLAIASAAGILIGFGLAVMLIGTPSPTGGASPAPAALAVGPQLALPAPLRGIPGRITYALDPDQHSVIVTWPVVIPHDAPAGASFRFEIGPHGSAASWSEDLSAREIRRHLGAADVVTLVVPAAAFSAGLQEARVVGVSAPEKPPTNLFVVEVLVVPAPR